MLSKAVFSAAFAASCVLQALRPPHAYADPGNDFLVALNKYGIDLTGLMGTYISPQSAIELGQDICVDLHRGHPPATEANDLYMKLPRITDKEAGNLVTAAQFTLCPDTA